MVDVAGSAPVFSFPFVVAFVMGLLPNEVFFSPIYFVPDCKLFSFVLQLMLISQEALLQAPKRTKFQNQPGQINLLTRTKTKTRTRRRRMTKKRRKRTKAKRKTKVKKRTIKKPARVPSNLLMTSAVKGKNASVRREPKRSESSVNVSDKID